MNREWHSPRMPVVLHYSHREYKDNAYVIVVLIERIDSNMSSSAVLMQGVYTPVWRDKDTNQRFAV